MEVKKSRFFVSCEEAAFICDKAQYNESTPWERFKLSVRMLYCKITRAYVKKNTNLSKLVNSNEVACMDNKSKTQLKTAFKDELNTH